MKSEPFREFVFCHHCNQWGTEDQFSVTTVVLDGVVRQLLYHSVQMYYDTPKVSHIANHHDFKGESYYERSA